MAGSEQQVPVLDVGAGVRPSGLAGGPLPDSSDIAARRHPSQEPTDITAKFVLRGSSPISIATDADDGLSDAPLADGWVLDGDPRPRMKVTSTSPGGGISSGVWCCQPSRFTFIYDSDEYVHIMAGRVTVIADTHVHELSAGSTAVFPRGLRTEWTVHEAIHKVFVLHNPPKWKRLLRRLAARLGPT